jgi:DNA-binding transcriptional LysR family regulator
MRDDIRSEVWGNQTGGFFCRPDHPLLQHENPTFELAHRFGFASLNVTPAITQSLEQQLGIEDSSMPLLRIKCDNLNMCRDICLTTDHILIAETDNILDETETGDLVPLELEFSFNRDLCIATKIGRLLPQSATSMIAYLQTHQQQIFSTS